MISDSMFRELEKLEAQWLMWTRSRGADEAFWLWSPNPLPKFRAMLSTATMAREVQELEHRPRFFEAGCGIGTKLYLAKHEHDLAEVGWEFMPEYVKQAKALGVNVHQADLTKSDPCWERFDIVYVARPFKDDDQEREWEQHVMDSMRPGAVFMAAFAGVKPYSWRWLYREPFRLVAVKPYPGEEDHTLTNVPSAAFEAGAAKPATASPIGGGPG